MTGFWFLRGRFLYSPLDLLPQAGRFLLLLVNCKSTISQRLVNAHNTLNALIVRLSFEIARIFKRKSKRHN